MTTKYMFNTAFDPEGTGYDMASARAFGMKPDKTGHYSSREPTTGLLLKGRKHKTWHLTTKGESKAGYEIYKKNGRYYSRKKRGIAAAMEQMGKK
ncbi:hypothetical protein LCGC14_0712660 [marine sediment metagenome]|uniref:Uncharacterized protein n=1 Tax=marine sediment metagenome TaxID=412755 RepID=A0A0F9QEM3_9ZZZZ